MRKEFLVIFFLLFAICVVFFYKMFFFGKLPISGDLLIAEYNPWKTYSYLGYVPGSFPNKAQYFDVLRQLYPWKTFTVSELQKGKLPLWNPYNFSGAPILANFQSAVFYPFTFLYLLFKQQLVWSFLVFLQPFLTCVFAYLYARRINISIIGSIFASISFAFSSFLTVWLEYNTINHVIIWLPLILLSIEHLFEKKTRWWTVIFVAGVSFSSFAGHIQVFGYMLAFILFYILFTKKRESLEFFIILFIVSLGIGCIQFIPGIELILHSARNAHSFDFFTNKILIQPIQLIMFFVPDFFGNPATRNYFLLDTYVGKVTTIGVIALFFIAFSTIQFKNKFIKFFWIAPFVILLFTTSNPFTKLFYGVFANSFILGSSPTLSIFLLCFSMSILAGFGIDFYLAQRINSKKFLHVTLLLASIFGLCWIFIFTPNLLFTQNIAHASIAKRNLLFPTAIFIFSVLVLFIGIQKKKLQVSIIVILFVVQCVDLFKSFHKFNPFSPQELIFPTTSIFTYLKEQGSIDRFWGYGFGSVEANFATQYALFSPDGYDPLYPKQYGEFIASSRNGKIATEFSLQNRSDAIITPGFGENDLTPNRERLRVLDMLGVKYLLDRVENNSTENTFPNDRFRLIYKDNGWRVFQNLKSSPRIFLTSSYEIATTKDTFEKLFFNKNFDPSKTIILEKIPDISINSSVKEKSDTTTKIISYEPQEITISTKSSYNKLLFLSDVDFPGWKATIDKKEVAILRADYAFRSVAVPSGTHLVKFIYKPLSFTIGRTISIFSLVFFMIFIYRIKTKEV